LVERGQGDSGRGTEGANMKRYCHGCAKELDASAHWAVKWCLLCKQEQAKEKMWHTAQDKRLDTYARRVEQQLHSTDYNGRGQRITHV